MALWNRVYLSPVFFSLKSGSGSRAEFVIIQSALYQPRVHEASESMYGSKITVKKRTTFKAPYRTQTTHICTTALFGYLNPHVNGTQFEDSHRFLHSQGNLGRCPVRFMGSGESMSTLIALRTVLEADEKT
jgi:hypothetical protein